MKPSAWSHSGGQGLQAWRATLLPARPVAMATMAVMMVKGSRQRNRNNRTNKWNRATDRPVECKWATAFSVSKSLLFSFFRRFPPFSFVTVLPPCCRAAAAGWPVGRAGAARGARAARAGRGGRGGSFRERFLRPSVHLTMTRCA